MPKYVKTAAEILPVAQALLVKEFPLRLRLLGIRMTHLKDLQGDDDKAGLKQVGGETMCTADLAKTALLAVLCEISAKDSARVQTTARRRFGIR